MNIVNMDGQTLTNEKLELAGFNKHEVFGLEMHYAQLRSIEILSPDIECRPVITSPWGLLPHIAKKPVVIWLNVPVDVVRFLDVEGNVLTVFEGLPLAPGFEKQRTPETPPYITVWSESERRYELVHVMDATPSEIADHNLREWIDPTRLVTGSPMRNFSNRKPGVTFSGS